VHKCEIILQSRYEVTRKHLDCRGQLAAFACVKDLDDLTVVNIQFAPT